MGRSRTGDVPVARDFRAIIAFATFLAAGAAYPWLTATYGNVGCGVLFIPLAMIALFWGAWAGALGGVAIALARFLFSNLEGMPQLGTLTGVSHLVGDLEAVALGAFIGWTRDATLAARRRARELEIERTALSRTIADRDRLLHEQQLGRALAEGIGAAGSLDAAATFALDLLRAESGSALGQAWIVSTDEHTHEPLAAWSPRTPHLSAFHAATLATRLVRGESLAGRAWASGTAAAHPDITHDPSFIRHEAAVRAGLASGFVAPVFADSEVVAVVEFFSREAGEPPAELVALVSAAVAPLGAVVRRRRDEDALRASEERFRELAENIQAVFWVADPIHVRTTYVSPAALSVWGHTGAEFVSDPMLWARALHPDDRATAQATVQRAAAERIPFESRYRIVRPDGTVAHIVDRGFPVTSAAGEVLRFTGIAQDVTATALAEAAAVEANARTRILAEAAFEGFATHADGVILEANAAFARTFGYAPDELVGARVMSLVAPESRAIVEAHLAAPSDELYEIAIVRKDGERRDVEIVARTAPYHGRSARITAVRDVTDERHARALERVQRERLAQLAAAQSTLGEGVCVVRGAAFSFVNPAFAAITGYTQEELLGMESLFPLVVAEDVDHVRGELLALLAGERERTFIEFAGIHKSGERRNIAAAGVLSQARDGPEVVAIVRDVTDERRAEQELEASKREVARSERLSALGTLVAGVAHEINNPLTFMRLRNEALLDALADAARSPGLPPATLQALVDAQESARVVLQGIDRITKITTSLKQISRVGQAGHQREDLNAIVEGVLTVTASKFKGHVHAETDLRATRAVRGSATELSQVVLNLVLNALDAMASVPSGTLTVRTFDEPGRVVLEVRDTGPGIAPADAPRLFTPFFTTKEKGTGLGLSVSWRIVDAHGGHLSFTTTVGAGTMFRVELPAAEERPNELPPAPGSAPTA
ncbi:MAG: PAS domain S-box protein [Thermoplasmatota archaeon]